MQNGIAQASVRQKRVGASNSGYSLAAGGDDQDDDPLIEDNPEITEWCIDDYTPSASRSTSHHRGFLHSSRDLIDSSRDLVFHPRPSKSAYQLGLCLTLAIGLMCGLLGAALGHWGARGGGACAGERVQGPNRWLSALEHTLAHENYTAYMESRRGEGSLPRLRQFFEQQQLTNIKEEFVNRTVFVPTRVTIDGGSPDRLSSRDLAMPPSPLPPPSTFYNGTLVDIDSCGNLAAALIRQYPSGTILFCGLDHSITVPLIASETVVLVLVYNRSHHSGGDPGASLSGDPGASLGEQMPVPYLVMTGPLNVALFEQDVQITVKFEPQSHQSKTLVGMIEGDIHRDEYILVGGRSDDEFSTMLIDSVIHINKALVNKGWKPTRTIVFLIWAVGADENEVVTLHSWIARNFPLLKSRVKLFLDLSKPMQGVDTFSPSGSVALKQFVYQESQKVMGHELGAFTLYDRWRMCQPQKLPYNYTIPRMDFPRVRSAASRFQGSLDIPVLSLAYKDIQKGPEAAILYCQPVDKLSASRLPLLESLAQLTARLVQSAGSEWLLGLNLVDVSYGLEGAAGDAFGGGGGQVVGSGGALHSTYQGGELRNSIRELQLQTTRLHGYVDYTSLRQGEADKLNERMFQSFSTLERLFIDYGPRFERIKATTEAAFESKSVTVSSKLQILAARLHDTVKNGQKLLVGDLNL